MLLYVYIHDAFLARFLLDGREEGLFFHAVVDNNRLKKKTPRIPHKIPIVLRLDMRRLEVDTIQAAEEAVVRQGHDGGGLVVLV